MERIFTGIKGFDELIPSGIPKGFQILLAGEAGTGKTIFSCQFALNKAKEGLKTYYLSVEESEKSIINNMKNFSWGKEFEMFVKEGKIIIERVIPLSIEDIQKRVLSAYDKYKFNFFILDTITAAAMGWKEIQDPPKLRRNIFSFLDVLRQNEITSFLLSEIEEGSEKIFKYGFEGFIVDGVIVMRRIKIGGEALGVINVLKIRGSKKSNDIFSYSITSSGIEILGATVEIK